MPTKRTFKLPKDRSIAERFINWATDKMGITEEPTYTDGYGIEKSSEVPLTESAQGQELSRMGDTATKIGLLTFGSLAPASRIGAIRMLNKGLGTVASADFLTSDRLKDLPKDIENEDYSRAAITIGEGALTGLSIGSAIKNSRIAKNIFDRLAKSGIGSKDNMIVHRAVVVPKDAPKPKLEHPRTGDNVYEIPNNQKYVGSYETAVTSVPTNKLNQTIVEHYNVPKKKVNILDYDVYPDGEIDLVASLSDKIYPTAYSTANSGIIPQSVPFYNWETMSNRLRTLAGGTIGLGSTGTLVYNETK